MIVERETTLAAATRRQGALAVTLISPEHVNFASCLLEDRILPLSPARAPGRACGSPTPCGTVKYAL